MAKDPKRLPPVLEGFQAILATGENPAASVEILNATGITGKTDALFLDADVEEIERSLHEAERDVVKPS
jgi:hypothetical protein